MRHRTIRVCVMCAALFRVCGATEPTGCPDTIAVHQQLTEAVAGWKAVLDDAPHRLASVTFYDGPPEEKASLVNDQAARTAGKETATWHFLPKPDRQIWLACGYAGTAIVLTKALPRETSACAVTYDRRIRIAGLPVIEKILCK